MVFRNTPANQRLAEEMEQVVNQYPGYSALVDCEWNCGKDIRFEILTSYVLQMPFTVRTSCTDAGYFGIKVQIRKNEFDSTEFSELRGWLTDLESMSATLKERIADAKPQRSCYAF